MKKVVKKVEDGMVVAVPLREEPGYLLCVVARSMHSASVSGEILGYFFSPILNEIPTDVLDLNLNAVDALCSVRTGTRRILEGKWRAVGKLDPFVRGDWPIPTYGRIYEPEPAYAWKIQFKDDRLDGGRIETRVSAEEAGSYPTDELWGVDIAVVPAMRALRKRTVH